MHRRLHLPHAFSDDADRRLGLAKIGGWDRFRPSGWGEAGENGRIRPVTHLCCVVAASGDNLASASESRPISS